MKTFWFLCVSVFYEITNTELVCKHVHCGAESEVDLSFIYIFYKYNLLFVFHIYIVT